METVKRTSYPSKQIPAGPAPLASFEDLPSDELESPEDVEPLKDDAAQSSVDPKSREMGTTLLSSSTLDSLTVSAQSTPQVEGDFDSNFTLTPVDSKVQPSSGFRTGSLSSLNKEEPILAKEKKGSAASLGSYDTAETEYNQRKSSWTDIFRSHNQNVKNVPDNVTCQDGKGKTAGKLKSDSSKAESSESRAKEKGKFLSLFKVGKKGSKQIELGPPPSNSVKDDKLIVEKICNKPPEDEMDQGDECKENEQPKLIEKIIPQVQNDLDKSNGIDNAKPNKSCEVTITRKNFNIAEKEYNIFATQNDEVCEKAINKCEAILKSLEDDHESSECELSFDVKPEVVVKEEEEVEEKAVDFEAENLLPQDSSEIDDDSSSELHPIPVFSSQLPRISRPKKRTDVTTIPVERPRSTTPINAAPLEAYIRAASPSLDRKVEKIKLSLPGEQFIGHMKSPKKSTTKSWSDFCEEILHSPRSQKKDEFSQPDVFADFPFECKMEEVDAWDNTSPSNEWVTFETKPESNGKVPSPGDSLQNSDIPVIIESGDRGSTAGTQNYVKCLCACHSQGCDNLYIKTSPTAETDTATQGSIKIDVFSDKCQCQCHEKYLHLWSPVSPFDNRSPFCDTKNSETFPDFTPSSIGS